MYELLKGNDTNEVSEDYEEKVKEFVASTSFSEMDENSDGKVSYFEFVNAFLEKDEWTTMLTNKIIG